MSQSVKVVLCAATMPSSLHSCLAVAALMLVSPYFVKPHELQCTPDSRRESISAESTELYLELEKQLVEGNHALLERLRAGFLTDVLDEVFFQLELQVVAGPSDTCGHPNSAFCPVENKVNYTSKLCLGPLEFKYSAPSASELSSMRSTNLFITWSTLVHGDWLSFVIHSITYQVPPKEYEKYVAITLQLDRLNCNPTQNLLVCDIDDLFSWIKLYAEVGHVPETWDRKQKGSTSLNSEAYDGFDVREITDLVSDTKTLLNLCLTEYVFVSLSLALVIAKLFPAIHSQIVSRATSLKSQSLYWGTAVVSNAFVYGLVFVVGKGFTLFLLQDYHPPTVHVATVLQVIIYSILLTVSLLTTKNVKTNVPIPKGVALVMLNISFCFTCFCCCVCCSQHCTEKTLQVLLLFSFMTFIYHSIMQAIAVGFALLVNVPETVALTALCTLSLLFFIVLFHYMIIASTNLTHWRVYQKTLRITASALMFVVIFCAILFIILVYMLMLFKLQPGGIAAVVSTLLPPVILSAAGWYVKTKLLNKITTSDSDLTRSGDENGDPVTECAIESTV